LIKISYVVFLSVNSDQVAKIYHEQLICAILDALFLSCKKRTEKLTFLLQYNFLFYLIVSSLS